MNKPIYLIVHHFGGTDANPLADTSNQTFEIVNEYHKSLWNFKSSLGFYTGYHYIIEKDGSLHQGRADTDTGAHTIGYNNQSLGIALAGNFDFSDPTPAQVAALQKLLVVKSQQYSIAPENIVPHRKFAAKSCYGSRLSDDWARNLVSPTMTREEKIAKATKLLNEAVELLKDIIVI